MSQRRYELTAPLRGDGLTQAEQNRAHAQQMGRLEAWWNRRRHKLPSLMLFSATLSFGGGMLAAVAVRNYIFAVLCLANFVSSGCWHINNLYMDGTALGLCGAWCNWIDRVVVAVSVAFGGWLASSLGLHVATVAAIAVPVLLVGLAAAVPWKRGRAGAVAARLAPVGVAAVILAIALLLLSGHWRSLPAAAVTVLGCWAIASSAQELLRRIRRPADFGRISGSIWGMSLAHSGLGVFAIGVASVSAFSIERDIRLAPGEQTEMAGYVFRFDGVQRAAGPNYDADRGIVQVLRGDRLIAELQPEKRLYRVQQNVMTDAAVDHTPLRDLYASLGEPLGDGAWSLRLYYKPMMRLVWLGGLIMALGGVLAVFDRRYRRATTARSDAVSP